MIELSSGEDDALQIVDSSDSGNEGEEDGSEESSGSHVNDALNQSDALGQVIVNINHPPNEEDIFLAPQLAHAVKPHQVGLIVLKMLRIQVIVISAELLWLALSPLWLWQWLLWTGK